MFSKSILVCFCLFTSIAAIVAQPVVASNERSVLWDNSWKFALADDPEAALPGYNDKEWLHLNIPHDWSIAGQTSPDNPMKGAGGYFPAGIGWYRKAFTVPASWKGKKVAIYFEGVYMNAEVFINGKSLGKHPYGYTAFYYDLTPYLQSNAVNLLAVRVNNADQINSRWYSGSGIYRHVWLTITNPVHIAQWGIGVTTPEVTDVHAKVVVKTLVKNESDVAEKLEVVTQVLGKQQQQSVKTKTLLELPPHAQQTITQEVQVIKPRLWQPETPVLYQARVQVNKGGKAIDAQTIVFGIRSLQFTTQNGFQLNGKTIKLNGGCVHHDNGCLGAAAYDRAEERKAELLKAAGFNAVRTAHNPPSEAFLNACDKLGLLVIDEAFDGWRESKNKYDYSLYFDEWSEQDVQSMVLRDRNHPSIICWSIGNEIIERKKPEAVTTARRLSQAVKAIDTTRPVTSAMTTWDKNWEMFDTLFAAHDVGGYNYQLHRALADHARVPSRIIMQTESYPKDAFFCWNMVQQYPYIIGDFVWTAMDYLGESGIGRYYYPGEPAGEHWEKEFYPWHGAYCGDIDVTGWRKPISHYRDMLYNNKEKLYMAVKEPNPHKGVIKTTLWAVWPTWESWTWPGYENKPVEVEIYSRYPAVRLYLNNQLVAEKPTGKEQEYKAVIPVPYTSGVLKAVGIENGKEVNPVLLRTADKAAMITAVADRKVIHANGHDLSYVTVEIKDKQGVLQPNASHQLNFTITGPGEIAGVDNGDLKDICLYVANTRKAWHGRAMVVIKSKTTAGAIRLKVEGEGLKTTELTVKSSY
ncbi:beta-galactosidase [Filimonas lacunae]|uniref:Beta-galactosidase n=1 Tax=Filimonas lacunae TaxID=477680 RepID=A0A173MD75_9BACT|nr:sugar-binding domain-containing protein [Filimonas lacunae]BAV05470.1 beta-galactosidase [Filimonas lacunae]SIT20927.1 beta-galactosidase [Filimonas lacunae]